MNRLLRLGLAASIAGALVGGVSTADAQIARQISYQGLLTQPSGAPIADGAYDIGFKLYDAATGGNLVWEETQAGVAVQRGLFNVTLGTATTLAAVNFEQELYLEVALAGAPSFARTKLTVVPYAVRAERALTAGGLDDNATGVVRSLNDAQGDVIIRGTNGITVTRNGDTIVVEGDVTVRGIVSLASPQGTIGVISPLGPNTSIDVNDGAITAAKLGLGAVTTEKITDGAVTAQKIAAGVIPTTLPPSGPAGGDLDGTYPNPSIRQSAVSTTKIADGAVTTNKIADNSINNAKIVDNAVGTTKIQDGAVTSAKLAPTGVTPGSYGTSLMVPRITVGADGRITAATMIAIPDIPYTGPAGGDLTGSYPNPTIRPSAIDNTKLADNAVGTSKIQDNSVTGAKIQDGTITAADIAPGVIPTTLPPSGPAGGDLTGTYPNPVIRPAAVDATKIADGAVTNAKLGANSVTTDKILNGTILGEDIAPGVIPTVFPPSGPAGGVLNGTYPNPGLNPTAGNAVLAALNNAATVGTIADARLNTTGVTPGLYGSGSLVPVINVDQYGRITSVSTSTITSATPTGPAGGDLQGTYPNPLINPTVGAGARIVDAIRTDFLAGDPDINAANNVVVLDATGRLPAVNGSQLTNLNANAITAGILPIQFGGTNSGTALVNNRFMVSNAGRIIEGPPLNAGQIFTGVNPAALPVPGTINAGPGIDVTFTAPNFVISSTDARLLPGTADNQTVRWDALNQQWVPNANVLANAGGSVTMQGNLLVNGTTTAQGNVALGLAANGNNSFGTGANSTNAIGVGTSTNFIFGATNINVNTDAPTTIGNGSSAVSNTTIAVGTNGNLTLIGIDTDANPTDFLLMNASSQVRRANANSLALEGIQFQNGAFRLGGQNATTNPLLSTRYINVDDENLIFTRINGTGNMVEINGGANSVGIVATTNVNTTGGLITTIGNPLSRTTIGGQLDPRGIIRNEAGDVVVFDAFQVIGFTQVNVGTDDNIELGNALGTNNQSIALSVGQGPTGDLIMNNIKDDPTPLYMLSLNGTNRTRKKLLADMADEGIQYQNGAFRLGAAASEPQPLRAKSYDENRFVNLDDFAVSFTNGSEGADGVTFFELDGNVGGAPRVQATALTNINVTGAASTNIGNLAAGGPVTMFSATTITQQSGTAFSATSGTTFGITVGSNYTLTVAGNATENITGDRTTTVGDEQTTTVQNNISTTSTAGNIGTTATAGSINENANVDISMTAGNDINGTATNNINLTATVDVNVQADNDVNILADNDVDIESINDYRLDVGNNSTRAITGTEVTTAGTSSTLTTPVAQINNTGTGTTQLGNGTGGLGAGRVGIGLAPTTATTTSGHGVPINANILLDVAGTTPNPNVRMRSLSTNNPTVFDNLVDGVVIADNNGVLRRVAEVTIIDGNNGLIYNETGTDYDVRLGTTTAGNNPVTHRPLQMNRFVNLDNNTLTFNRGAGSDGMLVLNGGTDAATLDAATTAVIGTTSLALNGTGAGTTQIGSATAGTITVQTSSTLTSTSAGTTLITSTGGNVNLTAPAGQINATAPTANINTAAAATTNIGATGGTNTVVGTTNVNATGNDDIQLGNGIGANANIGIGEASIGTHLVTINGAAQTAGGSTPNVRIDHLSGASLTTPYTDVPDNGVMIADGLGDMRKWDENTFLNPLAWRLIGNNTTAPNNILGTLNATDIDIRTNNLTRATIASTGNITIGNAATGGNVSLITTGANAISVEGTTSINTLGATNTTIGNGGSTTAINGPTNINASQNFNTAINTGTSTGTVTIGNAAAGAITATSGADITATTAGTLDLNAVNIDADATTSVNIDAPTTSINTAAASTTNVGVVGGTNNVAGTTNINASVNANTNINTGTSTGNVDIGNAAAGTINATSGASITAVAPAININQTGTGAVTIGSATAGAIGVTGSSVTINGSGAGTTEVGTGGTSGNVSIGSTTGSNTSTLQARNGGDVVVDIDNVNTSDLRVNGLQQALGTEDVLMIENAPANNVRRYTGTPGIVFTALAADFTYVQPAAQANLLVSPTINTGRYEVEVVLFYSTSADNVGLGQFGFIDFTFQNGTAVVGSATYGLAGSSGQALVEPSNTPVWGSTIQNIGAAGNPNVRATVIIKGTAQVTTAGTIAFTVGEDVDGTAGQSVTIHANSYMKLTRVGP